MFHRLVSSTSRSEQSNPLLAICIFLLSGCASADHAWQEGRRVKQVADPVTYYCAASFSYITSRPDGILSYTPGFYPSWLSGGATPTNRMIYIDASDCSNEQYSCINLTPEGASSFQLKIPLRLDAGADGDHEEQVHVTRLSPFSFGPRLAVDRTQEFGETSRRITTLVDQYGVLAVEGMVIGDAPETCYRVSEHGFFYQAARRLFSD